MVSSIPCKSSTVYFLSVQPSVAICLKPEEIGVQICFTDEIEGISKTFTELGLDSLDIAELIIQIEDDLGISIEVSHKINSVEKLAAYLEDKT